MDTISTITAYKREDFRKWLKNHHKKEKRVGIILYKRHTGKSAPTHRELMEEAICFGWIDTTIKRLDENRYIRTFAKRNPKSKWSENTLKYARELIKKRVMTPEGLKYYKLGRSLPVHDDGVPKNPPMPLEIKKALLKNKKAKANFEKLPPSMKKMLFRWYLSAKLPETKSKRVRQIIEATLKKDRDIFKANQKANG